MTLSRAHFLATTACAGLCIGAAPPDVEIPVELRGGRFFAIPKVNGRTFACWLDTDSDGFIFADAANRYFLQQHTREDGEPVATPPVLWVGPLLVVNRPKDDPIMQGFDAQIGAPWFAGRAWTFDYRNRSLTRISPPLGPTEGQVEIRLDHNYPRVDIYIHASPYKVDEGPYKARSTQQRPSSKVGACLPRVLFRRPHSNVGARRIPSGSMRALLLASRRFSCQFASVAT